jgi:hypothetical protein
MTAGASTRRDNEWDMQRSRSRTTAVGRSAGPGFAGIMLVMIGVMDFIQRLVAIVDDEF